MVSRFGRFLRKLRIDNNLILKDMADILNVSSSMLSAVENGKKSVPLEWEGIIIDNYSLSESEKEELHYSIVESIKQVRIDVDSSDHSRANVAVSFARNFEDLNEEKLKRIFDILESENKGD